MNVNRIDREVSLLAITDLIEAKGKATVRQIAEALSIPYMTAKSRVRDLLLMGEVVYTAEIDWYSPKRGPKPHFLILKRKEIAG